MAVTDTATNQTSTVEVVDLTINDKLATVQAPINTESVSRSIQTLDTVISKDTITGSAQIARVNEEVEPTVIVDTDTRRVTKNTLEIRVVTNTILNHHLNQVLDTMMRRRSLKREVDPDMIHGRDDRAPMMSIVTIVTHSTLTIITIMSMTIIITTRSSVMMSIVKRRRRTVIHHTNTFTRTTYRRARMDKVYTSIALELR